MLLSVISFRNVAKYICNIRNNPQTFQIKCACEKHRIRSSENAFLKLLPVERQPISVIKSVYDKSVFNICFIGGHILFHCLEIVLQKSNISVHLIKFPRYKNDDVAPKRGSTVIISTKHVGYDVRNCSVLRLLVSYICKPLFHKSADIVVICRRSAKGVDVSRPAQALVPLRAVRGNVYKVPLLSPDHVFVQAVETRVTCLYMPRAFHICMPYDRRNILFGQFPARQLHIAETVEGKFGANGFCAIYGKAICRLG